MTINMTNLSASLEIMWKGMAGLFIVCGLISVLILLISKIMMKLGK
jgi:Mg2+/Co2+ transporter CorB